MSKLRSLNTSFWSDPWIEILTPDEKLLFIYLITNEKTNMLGIYEVSTRKISFETGIDEEVITNALEAFERVGKVKYENNHVILVNYMKHQKYNPNMKKAAIDVHNNLPNYMKIKGSSLSKSNPSKAFESLLNHYGMVSKIEVEEEVEEEDKNETKNIYCEKHFLKDWNELRTKHLKKPSHLNNIGGGIERSSFNDLLDSYSREDFKNALIGLFKQKAWPNDNSQMASNPKHFLTHFNTYLTAFHDRNTELYGKQKTEATL